MKANNEFNELDPTDNRMGYVAFPFDEDQFKQFVMGLLGKPQKIEKTIRGPFEIELSDIQNFHYLIEQRINQQNQGHLLQFRAKIYFDDESSVELNSMESLETYNEVRPIISMGIELSWDFLILFNNKKTPEKQTININIHTGRSFRFSMLPMFTSINPGEGYIEIEIYHTARTWAADMEALLTNHIESILKQPNKIRKFVFKHEGKFSLSSGVLYFLFSVIGCIVAINDFISSQLLSIGNSILEVNNMSTKIDLLVSYLLSGVTDQFYFWVVLFLFFSLFMAIIIALIVSANIVPPEHSFLILTKKAKDNKSEIIKKTERKWIKFIWTNIINILISLLADYIFILIINR